MQRKTLSLLLIMAMGMMLLTGCGGSNEVKENTSVDTSEETVKTEEIVEETEDKTNLATEVLTDMSTNKSIELTYDIELCELESNTTYILSLYVKDDYIVEMEYWADYTVESYYEEQIMMMKDSGLEASELKQVDGSEKTVSAFEFVDGVSGEKYSHQFMFDVDGGVLIVHNWDLEYPYEEIAENIVDKIYVSVKAATEETTETTDDKVKIALTQEEREAVYKKDYDAIKDRIVKVEESGYETSYYDANGNAIMYIYEDGDIDVFFQEFYDNGVIKHKRIYSFHEDGSYGMFELAYHTNGNKSEEIVYEGENKIVFSFDENGDYVSGTEYDKDGNIVD